MYATINNRCRPPKAAQNGRWGLLRATPTRGRPHWRRAALVSACEGAELGGPEDGSSQKEREAIPRLLAVSSRRVAPPVPDAIPCRCLFLPCAFLAHPPSLPSLVDTLSSGPLTPLTTASFHLYPVCLPASSLVPTIVRPVPALHVPLSCSPPRYGWLSPSGVLFLSQPTCTTCKIMSRARRQSRRGRSPL